MSTFIYSSSETGRTLSGFPMFEIHCGVRNHSQSTRKNNYDSALVEATELLTSEYSAEVDYIWIGYTEDRMDFEFTIPNQDFAPEDLENLLSRILRIVKKHLLNKGDRFKKVALRS